MRNPFRHRFPVVVAGIVLSVLILVAGSASAQTTGRVVGQTMADDGSALPGVTVTLTSQALQGERMQVTDNDGRFRFRSLPPGTYTVTCQLEGFTTLEQGG
ncbi:MAG: carboxypeptidase-like regulatory domain-containing protein, partial [Holophagales bacterium]|nr:carboxypeptidase-like regulatory domain-containing protein [Holophagales bacterium]